MCACQRSLYPSNQQKKERKKRVLCAFCRIKKSAVHDEEDDVMNQCVLARGTAPFLVFLKAMNDETPVGGPTSCPPLRYMTHRCKPASRTGSLVQKALEHTGYVTLYRLMTWILLGTKQKKRKHTHTGARHAHIRTINWNALFYNTHI